MWKYLPDEVIVALYPARDIANNVRELNNATDPERSPYFVYRGDSLVEDESFQSVPALQSRQITLQNISYQINRHVHVLQAINTLQRYRKIRVAMAAANDRAQKFGVDNLEFSIYAPPTLPAMDTAWKVTEGLLIAVRDEASAHNARMWIVTLATRPQVIPDAAKRAELMQRLGVSDLSYADRRIREFGQREGIAVTDLAPAMAAYAQANDAYLNGFNSRNLGAGHWNETGHRLAGEEIADALCEDLATGNSAASTVKH